MPPRYGQRPGFSGPNGDLSQAAQPASGEAAQHNPPGRSIGDLTARRHLTLPPAPPRLGEGCTVLPSPLVGEGRRRWALPPPCISTSVQSICQGWLWRAAARRPSPPAPLPRCAGRGERDAAWGEGKERRCAGRTIPPLYPSFPPHPRCAGRGERDTARGEPYPPSILHTPLSPCGRGAGGEGRSHSGLTPAAPQPSSPSLLVGEHAGGGIKNGSANPQPSSPSPLVGEGPGVRGC